MLTAAQIRAARGLLNYSQNDLAEASGVALYTIRRMENSDGIARANSGNLWKVQKALEKAGVTFIESNGGGPGLRLRDSIEY